MRKYLVYYSKLLKVNLAYSTNFFLGQILDIVFFLSFFFLWKGVYGSNDTASIAGYTLSSLITYYFATEFIFRFDVLGSIYLNWDAWDGYLTNWLVKPIRVPWLCIIDPIVEKTLAVLLAFPTFLISYFIAREYILLPSFEYLGLFLVTVLLAFLLNITFNLCIHALVFRFGDQYNNLELLNYISWFLAGGFFPLSFLPGGLEKFFNLLPFKYLMYVPSNIFLEKYGVSEIILGWVSMFLWTAFFYFIFKLIYKDGLKYYTGVGR